MRTTPPPEGIVQAFPVDHPTAKRVIDTRRLGYVSFTGSVPDFLRQLLSSQGQAAANAQSLSDGQDVVVNALQQRVNDASGVNIDQEMANLITLQTAYGANARVMSTIRDMIDTLMKM